MAHEQLIRQLLAMYGQSPRHVATRQAGYRNHSYHATLQDGSDVNVIIYKREPGILNKIRRTNTASDFLTNAGFPTRATLGRGIIRLSSGNYTRYASLYTYLPGVTIPWEAYTKAHLKLLGATMSNMHAALTKLPPTSVFTDGATAVEEYSAIVARMKHYFDDPGVSSSMAQNLGLSTPANLSVRFQTALEACSRLKGQQVLHLDFVRGNILFKTTDRDLEISGILDFEKAAVGPPILDIARTLAFLLVDSKHKSETEVRKYFLMSGYNKRGTSLFRPIKILAGGRTIDLLEQLLDLFLTYDFYKFLRHNPYSSLHENEHFIRTRDLLLRRGLLLRSDVPDRIASPAR